MCLNEKKVSKYTPSNFGLQTRGSSESSVLILEWLLACAGCGVKKVTDGADINSELTLKKRDISIK